MAKSREMLIAEIQERMANPYLTEKQFDKLKARLEKLKALNK